MLSIFLCSSAGILFAQTICSDVENPDYSSTNLNDTKSNCHLVMDPIVGTHGENINLKATLLNQNDTGISRQQITFIDSNGTVIGENTTDMNGKASYNYMITQKPNKYSLNAIYNGSSHYSPSNSTATLQVNKWNVDIHVDDMTCKYGDVVPVTITLINDTNKAPLEGRMVNLRLSNGTFVNQGRTNSTGQFTYNYTVLNKLDINELEATVNSDLEYQYDIYFFNLTVKPADSKILMDDITCTRGNICTLTVKLLNKSDKPLKDEMIIFYQNGTKIGENTTNNDGRASYSYLCDSIGGYYPITAQYNGSEYYSPLNATSQLHVYNWKTILTISNMTAKPGEIITITAKLTKAITGEPLANKELGFNDFNSEYIGSNITNSDGEAQIQYQIPKQARKYRISAHFNAEPLYSCCDIASYIIVTDNNS